MRQPTDITELHTRFNAQAVEADRLAEAGSEADWREAAERADQLAERIAAEAPADTPQGRSALQAVAQRGVRDMGSLAAAIDVQHFQRAAERLVLAG